MQSRMFDNEDQKHIFTQYIWLNPSKDIAYENIVKGINEQKQALEVFIQKETLKNIYLTTF